MTVSIFIRAHYRTTGWKISCKYTDFDECISTLDKVLDFCKRNNKKGNAAKPFQLYIVTDGVKLEKKNCSGEELLPAINECRDLYESLNKAVKRKRPMIDMEELCIPVKKPRNVDEKTEFMFKSLNLNELKENDDDDNSDDDDEDDNSKKFGWSLMGTCG